MNNVLALFPGQGSQKVGMGQLLHEKEELAREFFEQADKILGFKLSTLCFSGPATELTNTAVAQPAILTVSVISYELSKRKADAPKICAAAGHSLGEYSALVAAGALNFTDAVLLVHKRGRYMQEAVPRGQGTMVAVLGKELSEIEAAIAQVHDGIVAAANINAPGQVVVAGDMKGIETFKATLTGGKVIPLDVSAPFHCKLMTPAAEALAKDLDAITIEKCAFPVYANVTGKAMIEPKDTRQNLKDQVCGKVRWVECMENAIKETSPNAAIEYGEGKVLCGLLKKINKDLPSSNG